MPNPHNGLKPPIITTVFPHVHQTALPTHDNVAHLPLEREDRVLRHDLDTLKLYLQIGNGFREFTFI